MVRTELYKIVPCHEHFIVYYQGIFVCTTDTIKEAEQEIYMIEMIEQRSENRTA